jgi:hypothetical protein
MLGREPLSVVTNAAYVAAGVAIALHGGVLAVYTGACVVLLGLASGWFHAAHTPKAQLADERGMYLAFTALLGLALSPVLPVPGYVVAMAAALLAALLMRSATRIDSFVAMPALVVATLAAVALSRSLSVALFLAAGFAAATLIRQLHDWSRDLRLFTDVIHAVWHCATATLIFVVADIILP